MELIQQYLTLLEKPTKRLPLIINTPSGKVVAVPLGDNRISGDLDYGSTNSDEMFRISAALESYPGFDDVRVMSNDIPSDDGKVTIYSIQWGEYQGQYPQFFSDVDAHRRFGTAYGYKKESIEHFCKASVDALATFAEFLAERGMDAQFFEQIPPSHRIEILKHFTGLSRLDVFGAIQLGALTPFPATVAQ